MFIKKCVIQVALCLLKNVFVKKLYKTIFTSLHFLIFYIKTNILLIEASNTIRGLQKHIQLLLNIVEIMHVFSCPYICQNGLHQIDCFNIKIVILKRVILKRSENH